MKYKNVELSGRLRDIADHVMRVFEKSYGKPYSRRQLQAELLKRGWNHHYRSVDSAIKRLIASGLLGETTIGRAKVNYSSLRYPQVDDMPELSALARSGQYPLYLIIAKMQDVGFPKRYLLPEEPGIEGRRTRDLVEKAKREILWWAGDFSNFPDLREAIENSIRRRPHKLRFQVLLNVTSFSLRTAKSLQELVRNHPNLHVRHWVSEWRGTIVDGAVARLVEKLPLTPEARVKLSSGQPGSEEEFEYKIWHIDGDEKRNLEAWVRWLRSVYLNHWEIAGNGPEVDTIINTLESRKRA